MNLIGTVFFFAIIGLAFVNKQKTLSVTTA
jgi:hypothetical protein